MAPPAQYDHCVTIYNAMLAEARTEEVEGQMVLVWEGFLTEVFQKQGLPQPYYTTVMHKLKAMECVIQLKRGGGGGTSIWALLKEPTEEEFMAAPERSKSNPSVSDQKEQLLRDTIKAVQHLQSEIDSQIETIHTRIDVIETQLHALAKEVQEINARHNP